MTLCSAVLILCDRSQCVLPDRKLLGFSSHVHAQLLGVVAADTALLASFAPVLLSCACTSIPLLNIFLYMIAADIQYATKSIDNATAPCMQRKNG